MKIAFISSKEGTGASTLSNMFSSYISNKENKTLLIDSNEIKSQDLLLSVENELVNIPSFVNEIDNSIIESRYNENLFLLKVKNFNDMNSLIEDGLFEIINKSYENIILDVNYNEIKNNDKFIKELFKLDDLILVINQDNEVLRISDKILTHLSKKALDFNIQKEISILINKFEDAEELANEDEILDLFPNDYLGKINYSNKIRLNANKGNLVNFSNDEIFSEINKTFMYIQNTIDEKLKELDNDETYDEEKIEDFPEGELATENMVENQIEVEEDSKKEKEKDKENLIQEENNNLEKNKERTLFKRIKSFFKNN